MSDLLPTDQLKALRQRFEQRLVGYAADLKALDQAWRADAVDEATAIAIVHRVSGSAATFGFAALSALAAEIEQAWSSIPDADRLRHGVQSLARAIEQELSSLRAD